MKGMTVSIQELKSRLSHYLRLAKTGQIIEITERGRAVGRLVPAGVPLQERLEALEKLGFLVRGKGGLKRRAPAARIRGEKTVAELLVEDRR